MTDAPSPAESRLAAALESVSDGVYALDADWRYVIFNRAAEEYFGVSRDMILGRILWEIFPQGRGTPFEAACHAARDKGAVTTFETRSLMRPERFVELRIAPMAPDGIAVSLTDVSERKATQDALRESQARLEMATEASHLGVWEWRLDTPWMVVSPRARVIWGFGAEEPISYAMLEACVHPGDRDDLIARLARAFDPAVRESGAYEYRIVWPGGAVRWVRGQAEAVFEEAQGGPAVVRYVGTAEDITEQRDVELHLRESESRLRLAVDAGRMAVWETDALAGTVVSSPEMNRMLGFADDDRPTLEQINARYAPGELVRLGAMIQDLAARGERHLDVEYRYLWPDGQTRWLMLRAELGGEPGGYPTRAVGVMMDITERKEAEERMKLLAGEVDHRANNLLALVQATVALSTADDVDGFKTTLAGRLSALARSHQLLAGARWQGADLGGLLWEELSPYDTDRHGRIQLSGPPHRLNPAAAQALSMALHELATNAAKHGALSAPEGSVRVAWASDEAGGLEINWSEHGGPPVSQPTRRGFGNQLLARALGGALGGGAELTWAPEGLRARLILPAS